MVETWRDKVAIVTGASSGLGRALSLELAEKGVNVALAARRADLLEKVAAEARLRGAEAVAVPADVTRSDDLRRLAEVTLDTWGRIDLLVANAGVYIRVPVTELTIEVVEEAMRVNLYGALGAVLAVLPHMLERRSGHLVLIGSVDGRKALPGDAPYVASKFGLTGIADIMRQELAEHGIAVTGVFPGRIDTPFVDHMAFPRISPKMSPESVARAVVTAVGKGRAEVVIPHRAWLLILLDLLAPRLADRAVRMLKLEGWEKDTRRA